MSWKRRRGANVRAGVIVAGLLGGVLSHGAGARQVGAPPEAHRGSEPRWYGAVLDAAADLERRAKRLMDRVQEEAETVAPDRGVFVLDAEGPAEGPAGDLSWHALGGSEAAPTRVVLLVHGLDEPGSIWNDLAPALRGAGYRVLRFDYANDQPIEKSAAELGEGLKTLRAHGTTRVDLVCHSMGGLVARDVLTRPGLYAGAAAGHGDLPDAPVLIMIGTPNRGSGWARLRAIAEIREQVQRFAADRQHDPRGLLRFLSDGMGEAGGDLLPGSAYLADLNARPLPAGVAITTIVGRVGPASPEEFSWLSESALARRVLGPNDTERLVRSLEELSTELGDGVVPVGSASLEGVPDSVLCEASHRGLIRRTSVEYGVRRWLGDDAEQTPAIPVIVDRLARGSGGAPAR